MPVMATARSTLAFSSARRERHAPVAQTRERRENEIGTLDVAEFADIGDVGGVVRGRHGFEFGGRDAVEHASDQAAGLADHALVGVAREGAFEQEQVRAAHQRAFEKGVERAFRRRRRIMQRAAVRRVDADRTRQNARQTHEGAGLRAMPVKDVRCACPRDAGKFAKRENVRRMRLATNGDPVHAELHARGDGGKRRVGALSAGEAVGENADVVSGVRLAVGEIEDVANDSSDRRADGMQDAKRAGRGLRHF